MNEIQFILYQLPDENGKVQVVIKDETIWATQKAMAQLFGVNIPAISKHLKNIFDEEELRPDTTVSKMEIVQMEGEREVKRETTFYSLDAIIAVGYRVSSLRATRFRQWATKILNEYIRKGFVLDDDRLKQGTAVFGKDYFRELLERVRSIRASERRIWQQITDIYAECSYDYDSQAETTRMFYQTVQNMMHYAVTHQTAAEIIYDRANAEKPYMGLMAWKNAPDGRVVKSDVTIAKNYLSEKEVESLNRLTSAFLDMAEDRAQRKILMKMTDWKQLLEKYLKIGDYEILKDSGNVSHEEAEAKAVGEYEKFRRIQDRTFMSDFDKQIEGLLGKD